MKMGVIIIHPSLFVIILSVLQLIPQFSPDCSDSSGVPVELPVKAGLAVFQVGPLAVNLLLKEHYVELKCSSHIHSTKS